MAHSQQLLRVFHNEPVDLNANRAGRLGPNQLRRVRSGVWKNVLMCAVLLGGLLAIFLLVAKRPFALVQYLIVGVLVVALVLLGFFVCRGLLRAATAGVVTRYSGPVKVTLQGRNGMWLGVAGESFRLPVRFWHVGPGQAYHVYVAPAAKLIVGMEPDGWDSP